MENRSFEYQEDGAPNDWQLNSNEVSQAPEWLYAADHHDDDEDDKEDESGDWGDVDPQGDTGNEPTAPGSAV